MEIVNELEKGGKNSLKKFKVACWIRREKKEKEKWNEEIGNGIWKVKLWITSTCIYWELIFIFRHIDDIWKPNIAEI